MNLKRIQTFIELIDRGSFSEVAEIFQITQPAVSKQIKTLEHELGVTLIHRDLPGLVPTAAGKLVYTRGKELMSAWYRLVQDCKAFQDELTGILRIGASTIPGAYILPPIIKKFHEQNPRVELSIVVLDSDTIIDMVRTHQLDIGMVGALTHAPGFIQYRVTSDRIVVIAPPNLDSNLTVREALAMPYITRDPGSGTRKAVEKALEQLSIPLSSLRIAAQAGSTEAVIALVSAGLGVSCVSDFAARAAAAQGRVSIIGELPSSRDFYLLLEEAKKDNPLIREFLRIHPAFSP